MARKKPTAAKVRTNRRSPKNAPPPGGYEHAGQPTLYRAEYCEGVIEHMKTGLSFETYAAVVGVHRDTLYAWRKEHREFSDSVSRGFDLSQMFWEKVGREGILGQLKRVVSEEPVVKDGKPVIGPDGKPMIRRKYAPTQMAQATYNFTMKNKFRWRDRVEHIPGDPGSTPYASLTEAEAERRIREHAKDLEPSIPPDMAEDDLGDGGDVR